MFSAKTAFLTALLLVFVHQVSNRRTRAKPLDGRADTVWFTGKRVSSSFGIA